MGYVATVNVPGYLPMDDDPPVFDTAKEAWQYLAEERERGEENYPDWEGDNGLGEYSSTLGTLRYIASGEYEHGNLHEDTPTNPDGTGTVYGDTPGYDGSHDLGMAYSVSLAIECEHDLTREKVTCGACGRSWCDRCTGTHGPRCPFEYDHPAKLNEAGC